MAEIGTALDLADGLVGIPEGCCGDRYQAVGVLARPVDQEVVVGPHALEHQLGLAQLEKAPRTEAADIGIQDLGADPLLVHERETGLRVVGTGGQIVPGIAVGGGKHTVKARHRVRARCAGGAPPDDPHILAVSPLHTRNVIAPLGGHARGPQIRRFGQMRVDVDDGIAIEEIGHGRRVSSARQPTTGPQSAYVARSGSGATGKLREVNAGARRAEFDTLFQFTPIGKDRHQLV